MIPLKPIYYTVHDWMVRDLDLKGGAERDVYALLYSLADQSGVVKVTLRYLVERRGYSAAARHQFVDAEGLAAESTSVSLRCKRVRNSGAKQHCGQVWKCRKNSGKNYR